MADPAGRVGLAFDDAALEPDPTFTWIDQDHPNLVASWETQRGRNFELDQTDASSATITITDKDGILDPTNPTGPYFFQIEPLIQATCAMWNPVTASWATRYRGWVQSYRYEQHPSQQVNQLVIELGGIFQILSAIQMLPGQFGDTPVTAALGQVFFDEASMDARIIQALTNAGIPDAFYVVFTGNVTLFPTIYSPGESPLTVIQEAADAEFPVANTYEDRFGRLAVHGRLAKFDPATIAAGAGDAAWDWHHWHAGDGDAVVAAPSTTAQVRAFGFERGIATIRNSALATPMFVLDEDVPGQMVVDTGSVGQYGIRSWSKQNLLTKAGLLNGNDSLEETKLFSQYIVNNYSQPANRIGPVTFRSMSQGRVGATVNWNLLANIDVADQLDATVLAPGGGGFTDEECFVEGIRERCAPLNEDFDDMTVEVDLSPKALFTDNPFPVT